MTGIDLLKINKLYQRDVTICCRCKSKQTIEMQSTPDYGVRPYIECPKCKAEDIYPWGALLIYQEEVEEVIND